MVSMTMSRLILRVEILKAKAGVSPWTQSTHLYDEDDLQLMPIHNNSRQFTRLAP